MRALGLDWSGGKAAPRKVWAAVIEDGALVELGRPFAGAAGPREIAAGFAAWLRGQRFDAAGFDFCFGLAAEHLAALGLPRSGPAALGAELRRRFAGPDDFRAALGPERRRLTDARAPFAPTNLRMYRQTYWGLCAMADVTEPVAPWAVGPRSLYEVLPRRRAAALCGRVLYKDAAGSPAERRRLVGALPLRVPRPLARLLESDRDGDALDAVLAALEAASAGTLRAPAGASESGEGFIYSDFASPTLSTSIFARAPLSAAESCSGVPVRIGNVP